MNSDLLNKGYEPHDVEKRWYDFWEKELLFAAKEEKNSQKCYSIVIPPPNVTGVLHMGHMLNNTIQDVLIRRKRMQGFNACWVPGTDHASIATEARVVNMLAAQGIQKNDLMRLVTKGLNRNERLIIILYYYEELTMKEIGATLSLSESRVSQMHSSIVQRLQSQLGRRRPEFGT